MKCPDSCKWSSHAPVGDELSDWLDNRVTLHRARFAIETDVYVLRENVPLQRLVFNQALRHLVCPLGRPVVRAHVHMFSMTIVVIDPQVKCVLPQIVERARKRGPMRFFTPIEIVDA